MTKKLDLPTSNLTVNNSFLARFEEIRKRFGLTKADFAAVLGLIPSSYSHLLNRDTNPDVQHVYNLWEQYRVSPRYLITGDGLPFEGLGENLSYRDIISQLPGFKDDVDQKSVSDMVEAVARLSGADILQSEIAFALLHVVCINHVRAHTRARPDPATVALLRNSFYSVVSVMSDLIQSGVMTIDAIRNGLRESNAPQQ